MERAIPLPQPRPVPSPSEQLGMIFRLSRPLAPPRLRGEPEPTPAERIERLYAILFANEGFGGERLELGPFRDWDAEALGAAVDYASDIIVRYVDYFYDPSLLAVTHYRKQRRVACRLDELLSPILRERTLRTAHTGRRGPVEEPDLFLREPIFYFKKEARTRAYPKNKRRRIPLDFLHERFRLLLMHREATA